MGKKTQFKYRYILCKHAICYSGACAIDIFSSAGFVAEYARSFGLNREKHAILLSFFFFIPLRETAGEEELARFSIKL